MLRKLGLEHEQKYLRELIDVQKVNVVEIPGEVPWREAAAATREAMASGAEAIYQATFMDEPWDGRADFLIRVDRPCELGPWSYEVVETKLAKSTKARALIQFCFLSRSGGEDSESRAQADARRARRRSESGSVSRTTLLRLLP